MRATRIFTALALLCAAPCLPAAELLQNGSFEEVVHDLPAGWAKLETAGRIGYAFDAGVEGERALKMEILVAGTPGGVVQDGLALAPGQEYVLTFQARSADIPGDALRIQIVGTDQEATRILDTSERLSSGWSRHRLSFTTGKSAPSSARLVFAFGPTGKLWLDQVSLRGEPAAVRTEAVPHFTNALPASSGKNLVPNGSFECGPDGWLSLGTPLAYGGNIAGLEGEVVADNTGDGTRAYRLSLGPGRTPALSFDCWPPAHVLQHRLLVVNQGWIGVKRGKTYTLSALLRADRAVTGLLQLNFNDDARQPAQALTHEVKLTREWVRYHFTVVAPADSVFVGVGLDTGATPAAAVTFEADAIQLEAGDRVTSWEARAPVEVGFNPASPGNVFAAGKGAVIDVTGSNRGTAPASVEIHVAVTDYWDRPLPAQVHSLVIPARGVATVPLTLDIPPGFYRAHFSWQDGSVTRERTERLAVIEPYTAGDSPFGLNHGPTTVAALHQIRQAGVTWIRNWSVNWEWAEPQPGHRSFAVAEPEIARLQATKMNILSLLPPNPSTNWASEAPASVPPTNWLRLAYAPKDPAQLFDFVADAAAHYRGRVEHWEFLNEPLWVPDFCLPKKGGYTVADYIRLLKGASAAIHRANPEAKVIGGLAIQSEILFGDEFIKAGGLDYVDILNLHPYAGTRTPESFIPDLERIQRVMDQSPTRKRIWATETGYYGLDEFPFRPWHPPAEHFAANRLLASEQQAGDYIVRYSVVMLANGVDKIFWHEPVTDDANRGIRDIENVFIAPGGLPRKSYAAISGLATVLGPAPEFSGKWPLPATVGGRATTGILGYAFRSGGHSVLIAWTTADAPSGARWRVALPPGCAARSIVGAPLAGTSVSLSESPVYLVSATLTPDALARQCALEVAP